MVSSLFGKLYRNGAQTLAVDSFMHFFAAKILTLYCFWPFPKTTATPLRGPRAAFL